MNVDKQTKGGLKTPISYYGGKQSMLNHILPLIPKHEIYTEPFFGGGAVYWAKEPVKCEVINDYNMNIVNFYEVLKHNYFDLRKKVEATLHSRETYKKALIIYECPWLFDEDKVVRAWAFYVVTNQGFSCKIGTWGYDRKKRAHTIQNKIDRFQEELSDRMRYTQIEHNKAHKVIQSRDTEDTFHYVDPPYIDTDQGHYGGYTKEHFERDLDALSKVKGKFLLSSYPSEVLDKYIKKYNWHTKSVSKILNAGNAAKLGKRRRKIEVLTANYPI
ncbi:modification methylase DpnIIA [Kordia sp. SMS9]|uniref:DNA adenine methylase n=1 Tax=Kordia sp. SMS9 TaxID=2282170 RepID=UPI000E0DB02A|nr:DNA adenine methylase [Kordia sp. SMS9]AXG70420.1 modification methylase DpnIIA [Kordia sp. SMS9]